MFAAIILSQNYDNTEFRKVELIKIDLRAWIINMSFIKTWSGVLILVTSISISSIFIFLVGDYFPIFFHKAVSSKIKSVINPRYNSM